MRTAGRILLWLLLIVPFDYVAMLLAVTVHEVLGHGGAAILLGGEFSGFDIQLDAMGSASVSADRGYAYMLAGGILSTTLLGWVFVAVGFLARGRPLVRVLCAVLALNLFLDGLPYGFWGAWFVGERGDVSSILLLVDWAPLSMLLVVGLGIAYAASSAAASLLLFRGLEDDLGPLSLGVSVLLALALTAFVGIGFAEFDWEQLIEGAGWTPVWGALVLQAAIGVGLVAVRRREVEPRPVSVRGFAIGIPAAWAACAAAALAVVRWLADGVYWG